MGGSGVIEGKGPRHKSPVHMGIEVIELPHVFPLALLHGRQSSWRLLLSLVPPLARGTM